MVKHVSIQNFKSIKSLEFDARRVNVFIGEPNTGKSNILEALGWFTPGVKDEEVVRLDIWENLFYDNDNSQNLIIEAGKFELIASEQRNNKRVNLVSKYADGDMNRNDVTDDFSKNPFRFYQFQSVDKFETSGIKFLIPPIGRNLFSLIRNNKSVRETITEILKSKGYKLNLRLEEHKIEIVKEENDILFTYPYISLSDTLQRIIFYLTAINTNSEAVLIFEEPEANSFPPYTKRLAKSIALDESNQYFIVTHSPYLLGTLIQKTPTIELNVFNTYMEDYQTKLYRLSDDELSKVWDYEESVFFNLDRFLPDDELHR